MVTSSHYSRKYVTSSVMLHLFNNQIKPKMEHCCHIQIGVAQSALSSLDRAQNRIRVLCKGKLIPHSATSFLHRCNVIILSLPYQYFNGKCSDVLFFVLLLTFTARTHICYFHGVKTHIHFLRIPFVRMKCYSHSFFSRIATLQNSLPCGCFLDHCKINLFTTIVIYHTHHNFNSKPLPRVALRPCIDQLFLRGVTKRHLLNNEQTNIYVLKYKQLHKLIKLFVYLVLI